MAFRKKDVLNTNKPVMFSPIDWSERQRKVDEVATKSGDIKKVVKMHNVACEEISKQQLDPREVTAEVLISNDLSINPDSMKNCLNPTSPEVYEDAAEKIMNDIDQKSSKKEEVTEDNE